MQFSLVDLHTDLLSSHLDATECVKYLSENNSVYPCLAVFSKNGEQIDWQIDKLNEIKKQYSAFSLGLENIHYANMKTVDDIFKLHPLYVSLTWNCENSLSGGCYDGGKLTTLGKEIVKILSASNVLIDTAHLSHTAFYELADIANVKLINSHTCFDSLNHHVRNITDEEIKIIISNGGIIGLTFVNDFLCGNGAIATVCDVVKHIDYFCQKFDYRKLTLGTDFYGSVNLPKNLKNYKMCLILLEKLFKIGYNVSTIKSIMSENFFSFIDGREVTL